MSDLKKAKQKPKSNGLEVSEPYMKTPIGLWLCPEFNVMKTHSRCLYMIILAKTDPYKIDDFIYLPYDEIETITKFNRHRISNSLKELEKDGWIEIGRKGRFPHCPNLYRIDKTNLIKGYPKIKRTLPDYLKEFINNSDG